MELTLKTQERVDSIVNNLVKASTIDIKYLSVVAYKFLYNASGSIAHFDIFGYIAHYGVASNLGTHILMHQDINQWKNYASNHEDYEYMMQKKEIYNLVCDGINKWREDSGWNKLKNKVYEIRIRFTSKEKNSASAYAEAMRHNFMDIPNSEIEIKEIVKKDEFHQKVRDWIDEQRFPPESLGDLMYRDRMQKPFMTDKQREEASQFVAKFSKL